MSKLLLALDDKLLSDVRRHLSFFDPLKNFEPIIVCVESVKLGTTNFVC